jgi:serine/threonine-protein kinase
MQVGREQMTTIQRYGDRRAPVVADRYELGDRLGGGALAEVYRAFDLRLGRAVALKLFTLRQPLDASLLARFGRVVEAAAALDHPHIAATFDYGVAEPIGRGGGAGHGPAYGPATPARSMPYVAMELVPGGSLETALRRRGPLPAREALTIGAQLASALEAAHRHGTVHGALHARNVLLDGRGTVRVTDVGIARVFAPAHRQGPADIRTDLDALRALLAEMLTVTALPPARPGSGGRTQTAPRPGGPSPAGPSPRAAAPPMLAALLAPNPAARYGTAAGFREAVVQALEAAAPTVPLTVSASVPRSAPPASRPLPPRPAGPSTPARVPAPAAAVRPGLERPRVPSAAAVRPGLERPRVPSAAAVAPRPEVVLPAVPRGAAPRPRLDVAGSRQAAPQAVAPPPPSVASPRPAPAAWPTAIGLAPLAVGPGASAGASAIAATASEPRRRDTYARLAALMLLVGASALGALALATRPAWAPGPGRTAPAAPAAATALPPAPAATVPAVVSVSETATPAAPAVVAPAASPAVPPEPTAVPVAGPADPLPPPALNPQVPESLGPPSPAPPPVPLAPDASDPVQAVRSFYGLVGAGQFEGAAGLWTPRMVAAYPPGDNIVGRFGQTRRVIVQRAEAVGLDPSAGRATVAVDVLEVLGPPPVTRRYVGTWQLVRSARGWLLDQPNLRPG